MPSKLSPLCAARVFAGVTNLISALLLSSAASAQQMPVVEAFARDFDPAVFLAGGEAFAFDLETLRALPAEGDILVAGFPLPEKLAADLLLHRINPRKPGALSVVVDQFGRELPMPQPETHFFGGSVVGIDGSGAFIGISPAGVFGWIETAESRYMITSGPFANPHAPAVFDMASEAFSAIELEPFQCEYLTVHGSGEGGVSGGESFLPNCRQIDLALDTDQEFLGKFNGNTAAALGYIQTLVAGGDEIYRRDNAIQLRIAYTRLWSVSDPWTQTSTGSQLPEFRNYWNANMSSISRDVAHLLSGRSLGGGIAWVPGICSSYAYSVASGLSGYFPTPLVNNSTQNWDIMVSAHEIGHGLDMSHTHQLTPPVDGCGNSPADCTVASAGQGTIMSYCHLCGGGLTNIRLEFHPENIAESLSFLGIVSCNYSGPAVPPVAIADSVTGFAGLPTRIDVLANELGVNCEGIIISAFASESARGAAITRSVGTGPDGRDELEYALPATAGAGTDTFSYTVRDTSGQTATASVRVNALALRTPDNPVGTTPALDARYYTIAGETALPDYALRTPYALGAIASLNYPASVNTFASSGRSDFVGARFAGWLSVPSGGLWTLSTASDEGSRITVGSTVVVDHDGVHEFSERSGSIALAAGLHPITIDYFERTGPAGLVVSWEGPGVSKQVIPASQFYRGGSNLAADLNNDGSVNASDIALILDNWGVPNSPYDITGDGVVTGADLAAVLFAWTG